VFTAGRFYDVPAYISSPVKIEAKSPDDLTGSEKLGFTFDRSTQKVNIDGVYYPLDTWVKIGADSLRFRRNPRYDGSYHQQYFFTLEHPSTAVWEIKDHLEVSSISKSSTILELLLKDAVPKRSTCSWPCWTRWRTTF
jgi:tyrosine-protein kinase Etk/Wzc